jgi:hypothetical protein
VISFYLSREKERPRIRIRKKTAGPFRPPRRRIRSRGRIRTRDGVETGHFSRTMRWSGGLPALGGGGGGGLEEQEAVFFGSVGRSLGGGGRRGGRDRVE